MGHDSFVGFFSEYFFYFFDIFIFVIFIFIYLFIFCLIGSDGPPYTRHFIFVRNLVANATGSNLDKTLSNFLSNRETLHW